MKDWTPKEVKDLRESLGESQKVFGDRFDVWPGTVGGWESGRHSPGKSIKALQNLWESDEAAAIIAANKARVEGGAAR